MNKITCFIYIFLLYVCNISNCMSSYKQIKKTLIFPNDSVHVSEIVHEFNRLNIQFEMIESLPSSDDNNLYLLFDLYKIPYNSLPKYYIAYQTLDLSKNEMSSDYLNKLESAIVVWDVNEENIKYYDSKISNYFHYPLNYKFADPLIAPCLLPLNTLNEYKDLVIYSNKKNTDISSHLPTLFFFSIMQNPKVIVEAGVRGGESSLAFKKSLSYNNSILISIDIDPRSAKVYDGCKNAVFNCMNDLNFASYYTNSAWREKKIDIVFIDTTHLYKHTLKEIDIFVPLLNEEGMIIFHDSNVTPINKKNYLRLNGTMGEARGNANGVISAIKEYFSLSFDEDTYVNTIFFSGEAHWYLIGYPFCNGLTILKKLIN